MTGIKDDRSKPQWDLLPFDALNEVVRVLDFGANKYGRRNWEAGMVWGRHVAAALRHIRSFMEGETYDPESRVNHLAHAACDLLFVVAYNIRGIGVDDRRNDANEKS